AKSPVPSGELSSTTRTSMRGSCRRIAGTIWGRLVASLYVGTMTRTRSITRRLPPRERGNSSHRQSGKQGDQTHQLTLPVGRRVEGQIHLAGPGGKDDAQQGVVRPKHRGRFAIYKCVPVRIPVLGNKQVTGFRIRSFQIDRHLPWRPLSNLSL